MRVVGTENEGPEALEIHSSTFLGLKSEPLLCSGTVTLPLQVQAGALAQLSSEYP